MLYFLAAMKLSNYTLYRKCHFKKNLVVGRNENEKKILCLQSFMHPFKLFKTEPFQQRSDTF